MTVTNEQLKTLITNNATVTNANFKKAKQELAGKVDKVEGKGLSTNDYTTAEKNKLGALPTNAELQAGYVAQVSGKGLSTEDYTTAEKTKLGALPTNSELQTALDGKTTMAAVEAKGYQTASDVATAIAGASHLKRAIVESLPAVANADANTIYMILKSPAGDSGNVYNEYFVVNGAFELIGDSKVDLTGYATEAWVGQQGYLTQHQDISGKQDVISDLTTIRSGAEAGATAVQPAAISDMASKTWVGQQGYLTSHQDISGKVDKVTGKGLSTNDFTDALKTKLEGVEASADANIIETVKVNGSALTPDANKAVDITVPTNNNVLVNGAGYQTAQDVTNAINTIFGDLSITAWDSININE